MKTRNVFFLVLSICLTATACTKSERRDIGGNPPPEAKLTGYWEAQDTRQLDDEKVPYRLRFFVNSNGMEEIQFCALNGSHGFSAWSNQNGPHKFEIETDPRLNTSFQGSVTRIDATTIQLNGKYEYRRMAIQPTAAAMLATDKDNSLCTL